MNINESIERRLDDHMTQDDRNFDRLIAVLEKFSLIDVHINEVDARLTKTETHLEWLMKAFWAVVIPLAAGLVAAVLALILKR